MMCCGIISNKNYFYIVLKCPKHYYDYQMVQNLVYVGVLVLPTEVIY